jgi:hypothetical protein
VPVNDFDRVSDGRPTAILLRAIAGLCIRLRAIPGYAVNPLPAPAANGDAATTCDDRVRSYASCAMSVALGHMALLEATGQLGSAGPRRVFSPN